MARVFVNTHIRVKEYYAIREPPAGTYRRSMEPRVLVIGLDPEERLELFETIVNLAGVHAPGAAIAFNSTPDDIVEAVQRRLDRS